MVLHAVLLVTFVSIDLWYLDDATIRGFLRHVASNIQGTVNQLEQRGLQINSNKGLAVVLGANTPCRRLEAM